MSAASLILAWLAIILGLGGLFGAQPFFGLCLLLIGALALSERRQP